MLLMLSKVTAQVIDVDPLYPTINDSVKITFHVDQCGCNLNGYTGDIYAHTGVLTTSSTNSGDWKHVRTVWGVNTAATKLVKINSTTYVLHITPDIKNYYEILTTDTVTQMAFVFRSSDASKQTANIYTDVYPPTGLTINLTHPRSDTIVMLSDTINISAMTIVLNTPNPDSISLYIDDTLRSVSHADTLYYPLIVTGTGKHWIKVVTGNGVFNSSDSAFYFVRNALNVAPLPAGVKDGINYIDTSKVTLVLFAPHKDNVFLIGDLTDWEMSNVYLMNRTPDSSRYWIALSNLEKGREYAFQYLVDGNLRIADPYTDKILDPDNDKYIPVTTYPGLKAYPTGKTTQIVSVFQTNQEPYAWEDSTFTPAKTTDLVIYELLVRDFTAAGTFKMTMDSLGYLKKLGINAIELMPVNEFEGNSSWGYNPSFYFAVDKAYGTKNDYKKFVDECHKQGIAVIMDIVLNHSYGSSPMVRLYMNSETGQVTSESPWFNQTCPHPPYCWGYDFNHQKPATKAFVARVNHYWLDEYKIDGYRFDFTKGFTNTVNSTVNSNGSAYDASRIAILESMYDSIKAFKSNAIVIFEHFTDNSEEKVLANHGICIWGNMNYNYNQATMGYIAGSDISGISYKPLGWNNPSLVGYMESHDEERLMYNNIIHGNSAGTYNVKDTVTGLRRMETAASFFLTVPGPKMIWQFGELGYDISRDWNGRTDPKPIRWDYYTDPDRKHLYDVFSALSKLHTSKAVFETTNFDAPGGALVKEMHLNSSGMNVTIIGNFDVTPHSINPAFQHTGTWYDYFSGTNIDVTDVNSLISLVPGEYHLITDSVLATPDITPLYPVITPVAVQETSSFPGEIQVFPNPTNGNITLLTNTEGTLYFELYDLANKKLYSNKIDVKTNQSCTLNLKEGNAALQKGLYIYKILLNKTITEGKLLIE